MAVPSDSLDAGACEALDSRQEPSLAELMRALARAPAADPALPDLEDGEMIGEHLRIQRRLGRGGMGVVYLAHDLRLDRQIAVKLLAGRGRTDGVARLEREARAMAKLSHPNVAVVHEVGHHRGQPYIAMEYVDGGTARSWLRERSRSWREIVALYLQAARGLAAAHAAGFVHRDFKPDNVLVGADGRARVADFGLVRLLDRDEHDATGRTWEPHADALASRSHETATDAVMGTPAYMAPEQKLGAEVGPASDQFALCLALREALDGDRGRSARRIPTWLEKVIARGTASEPAQRWPSVDALADRLEHGLGGGARRAIVAGIAVTAILAAVIGVALGARTADHGCDEGAARIAEHDSAARRGSLAGAFTTSAGEHGTLVWTHAAAALDRWSQRWAQVRDGSCRATRIAGTQTERLLERSLACLDERSAELDATLDALDRPTAATVQVATAAIAELPGAAACGDAGYLLARPDEAVDEPLRTRVRRVAALRRAARLHAADLAAAELRGDGTSDEVLHELAALARAHGDTAGARRLARDAYLAARHAEHDELAARAALLLGELELAPDQADSSAASTWIGFARVELERGVADPRLWIPLERAQARVREAVGDHAGARAHRERALELAASDESSELLGAELQAELAGGLLAAGSPEPAELAYRDAIAALAQVLGAEHPALSRAHTGLAIAIARQGRVADALVEHRRAAAIERDDAADAGPSQVDAAIELALALFRAGELDDARAELDLAIARLERRGEGRSIAGARALAELARVELAADRRVEAGDAAARVLAIGDQVALPAELRADATCSQQRARADPSAAAVLPCAP